MILNFSIKELCASSTAKRLGISNTPDLTVCDNLMLLIVNILQPLRTALKTPVIVSSGYRCKRLNDYVKGAANSGHLRGTAADITAIGLSVEQLYQFIKKSGLKYTQLIQEKNEWIHVEYDKNNLKCENLRYDGKTYKLDK